MRVLLRHGGSACVLRFPGPCATALEVKQAVAQGSGVAVECQRLVCGARELRDEALISSATSCTRPREIECVCRLSGGKGGFGAMLRSARGGLDAKKTTNFDAMRDLSGRRSAVSPDSHSASYQPPTLKADCACTCVVPVACGM